VIGVADGFEGGGVEFLADLDGGGEAVIEIEDEGADHDGCGMNEADRNGESGAVPHKVRTGCHRDHLAVFFGWPGLLDASSNPLLNSAISRMRRSLRDGVGKGSKLRNSMARKLPLAATDFAALSRFLAFDALGGGA
jgi:hypothetical protein